MVNNLLKNGQEIHAQPILQRLHTARTVSEEQKKWAESLMVKINRLPAEALQPQPAQPLPNAIIDGQPVNVPQPQLPNVVVDGIPVTIPDVATINSLPAPASAVAEP